MTDDSKPNTPAAEEAPARSDSKLPTEEIDRIAIAAARELTRTSSAETQAQPLPTPGPDPLAAMKTSPLGQMAALLASLTGLSPRAVFVVLLLIGLQTGLLQRHFPTLGYLDQAAAEVAKEQVEADELKVHARLNKLDERYHEGCDSQQADIDKNADALRALTTRVAVLEALVDKQIPQMLRREESP